MSSTHANVEEISLTHASGCSPPSHAYGRSSSEVGGAGRVGAGPAAEEEAITTLQAGGAALLHACVRTRGAAQARLWAC